MGRKKRRKRQYLTKKKAKEVARSTELYLTDAGAGLISRISKEARERGLSGERASEESIIHIIEAGNVTRKRGKKRITTEDLKEKVSHWDACCNIKIDWQKYEEK